MGACYLMRNNEDNRYYVIKQIDLAKMSKKERQQALNEARVLSALKHPNIINYVDSFLARRSDHLCIVMEYAEGGDIAQKVKSCRGRHMREEQILDWFIQTCLAIHAIHQKHILHRDVKTQNVFLTSQNVVKLGDFGIARVLQNTFDQAHTFVGTPYYLSPELVQEKPYDTRSDTWALGVVLYEMMALRHPFNANDMKSLMTKILRVQYDPPPSFYSQELRDVVSRTLVKDPRQRISLQDILSTPLVGRRISQWVCGGSGIAQGYLHTMLQHRLLPGYTNLPDSALPSGLPTPTPSGRGDGPVRTSFDAGRDRLSQERVEQQLQHDRKENAQRRDDIRREFGGDGRSGLPAIGQNSRMPPLRRESDERRRDVDSLYEGFSRRPSEGHGAANRWEDGVRHHLQQVNQQREHPQPSHRPANPSQNLYSAVDPRLDLQRQRELQKERELQQICMQPRHPQLARLGQPRQLADPRLPARDPERHLGKAAALLPRMPSLPSAAPSHHHAPSQIPSHHRHPPQLGGRGPQLDAHHHVSVLRDPSSHRLPPPQLSRQLPDVRGGAALGGLPQRRALGAGVAAGYRNP